jgi:hypothetical protein
MSEEATMTDAQKRAAARKAKILARGNAGLAKLAQTARGEEAEMLYGGDCKFYLVLQLYDHGMHGDRSDIVA